MGKVHLNDGHGLPLCRKVWFGGLRVVVRLIRLTTQPELVTCKACLSKMMQARSVVPRNLRRRAVRAVGRALVEQMAAGDSAVAQRRKPREEG